MSRKKKRKQQRPSRAKTRVTRKKGFSTRAQMNVNNQLKKAIQYHKSGQLKNAEEVYQKILKTNPNHALTLHMSGLMAHQLDDNDKAVRLLSRAIENEPDIAMYHNNLGLAFEGQQKLDEAISCYLRALQLDPECYEAYTNMGNVLMAQGKLREAISSYKSALRINASYAEALVNLVNTQRVSNSDTKELLQLAESLIQQELSEDDSIRVYFSLGKLCDVSGMFERGFEYFRLGNALKRGKVDFNMDAHKEFISRMVETFSYDFVSERQSWGCDSEAPVFVFGMPRSGTTLVEQIIASHPNAFGAGELQFFVQAENKLPAMLELGENYPECVNWIHRGIAKDIGELYVKQLKKLSGLSVKHSRITDKNPFNFLHLGLISLLLPKARFIHCKRHPLDTCLSIYFHLFTTYNYFAYDLAELGAYYREYRRLMNHWSNVLPQKILELEYEELVRSQEMVSRRLIEYCGLEWDPACLRYYDNDRPVLTATNWQVRQPIYNSSCDRWQNYDQFLNALKDLVADFI
jgi:tetratricopeptide (TPR) repeat protein